MLCHNIHSDLAEIEIGADPGGRRNAGLLQDILYHLACQISGTHAISAQIGSHIHHDLINGVDMNILRGDILQIDIVDPGAVFHVECHPWRGDQIINRKGWILLQIVM